MTYLNINKLNHNVRMFFYFLRQINLGPINPYAYRPKIQALNCLFRHNQKTMKFAVLLDLNLFTPEGSEKLAIT